MDKSKQYIDMCKEASDLHAIKWNYGFIEGDYLYVGDAGIKVIGSDILEASKSAITDKNDIKSVRLELIHTEGVNMDVNNTDVDITVLDWPVDTYINPIWLPRQDQLEYFYYQSIIKENNIRRWLNDILDYGQQHILYSTMEQTLLDMVMRLKFNLYWKSGHWSNTNWETKK